MRANANVLVVGFIVKSNSWSFYASAFIKRTFFIAIQYCENMRY